MNSNSSCADVVRWHAAICGAHLINLPAIVDDLEGNGGKYRSEVVMRVVLGEQLGDLLRGSLLGERKVNQPEVAAH